MSSGNSQMFDNQRREIERDKQKILKTCVYSYQSSENLSLKIFQFYSIFLSTQPFHNHLPINNPYTIEFSVNNTDSLVAGCAARFYE